MTSADRHGGEPRSGSGHFSALPWPAVQRRRAGRVAVIFFHIGQHSIDSRLAHFGGCSIVCVNHNILLGLSSANMGLENYLSPVSGSRANGLTLVFRGALPALQQPRQRRRTDTSTPSCCPRLPYSKGILIGHCQDFIAESRCSGCHGTKPAPMPWILWARPSLKRTGGRRLHRCHLDSRVPTLEIFPHR